MGAGIAAPLVGRADPLRSLRLAAEEAAEGHPGLVLLEGEAGIGKTRLVTELTTAVADSGGLVLTGHCTAAAGRHLPFGPWSEVLRDLVRQEGRNRTAAWAGARLPALAHLCRELAGPGGSLSEPAPGVGALHEAVVDLVSRVANQRTTVVVIEDLHWSDSSSRELLDHLVRVLRGERLLIVVTSRTDEVRSPRVDAFLLELRRVNPVVRLVLPRLSREGVAELVEGLTGSAPEQASLDVLERVTQGVPFLVEEAVAANVGEGVSPASFARELVGHRLSALTGSARALVHTAAVKQDRIDVRRLAAASGLRGSRFDSALRRAGELRVLEPDSGDPGRCRFRHALLREAALATLSPGELEELHRRWARVLTDADDPQPSDNAAELATHWLGARDAPRALAACFAAADEAGRLGAYTDQARWLDRAVRLWPEVADAPERTGVDHVELLARAGEAMMWAGHLRRSGELLDAGLRQLSENEAAAARGWLQLLRAWLDDEYARLTPLADVLAAVDLIPRTPPTVRRVRALQYLVRRLVQAGLPARGLQCADEAAEAAQVLRDRSLRAEAMKARGLALAHLGRDQEGVSAVEEAVRLAEGLELQVRSDMCLALSVVLWTAGRVDESLASSRRGVAMTGGERPGGIPPHWGCHMLNMVEDLLDLGQWEDASEALAEVEAAAITADWLTEWRDRLARHLAAWRGEDPLPQDQEVEAPAAITDIEVRQIQDLLPDRHTWADIAALHGRTDEVRRLLGPILAEPRCVVSPGALWPVLEVAARVEGDAGRAQPAGDALAPSPEVVTTIESVLRRMPPRNPRDAAFARTVSAHLARARGEPTREGWSAAVEAWRKVGFPHYRGWAALRLAEAAAPTDRDLARHALLEAVSIAGDLRAAPLDTAVRALGQSLRIALPARRTALDTAPLPLTPRELEVLALLSAGCSNQEIAVRLFISPKTASVHVTHILAKLGVASRGQAAALAHETGLLQAGPLSV